MVWGHEFGSNEHSGSIYDPTIFSDRCRGRNRLLSYEIINNKQFMLNSSLSRSRYQLSYKTMFIDQNWLISYSHSEIIYHNYILWDFHGRSYHCTAVGAIWNLSKFTASTGKSLYSIFLKSRSVLGAKISGVF